MRDVNPSSSSDENSKENPVSRRRLLGAIAAGALTGVAGCTSGGEDGSSNDGGDGSGDGGGDGSGDGSSSNGGGGDGNQGNGGGGDGNSKSFSCSDLTSNYESFDVSGKPFVVNHPGVKLRGLPYQYPQAQTQLGTERHSFVY